MTEIICKDAFVNTIRKIDALTDNEFLAIQTIWKAAEQAMQGKTIQECSLFKPKQQESNELPIYYADVDFEESSDTFTREELQMLKSRISGILEVLEYEKVIIKNDIGSYWERADKNSPKGRAAFEEMNQLRNYQRKLKKDVNKLAALQAKIKRKLSKGF